MELKTRVICGEYLEVKTDEIESVTINKEEARELASNLTEVVLEILSFIK